jgi:hypothetical protein
MMFVNKPVLEIRTILLKVLGLMSKGWVSEKGSSVSDRVWIDLFIRNCETLACLF